jgi:hypothetical protein
MISNACFITGRSYHVTSIYSVGKIVVVTAIVISRVLKVAGAVR